MCDVEGCDAAATAVYLHAVIARAAEFKICEAHFNQMKAGKRPRVAAERFDLADLSDPPTLLLE